jgi:hypothetical protein
VVREQTATTGPTLSFVGRRVRFVDRPDTLDVQELARSNERLREQQDAISGVLSAVVRSAELQPVLDEVTTAAMRLCAGQYGILYLAEGDLLRAVAGVGGIHQWEYDKTRRP